MPRDRNAKPKADPHGLVDPILLQRAINEADQFSSNRDGAAWARKLVAAYLELSAETDPDA